jgi:hypothetical protein
VSPLGFRFSTWEVKVPTPAASPSAPAKQGRLSFRKGRENKDGAPRRGAEARIHSPMLTRPLRQAQGRLLRAALPRVWAQCGTTEVVPFPVLLAGCPILRVRCERWDFHERKSIGILILDGENQSPHPFGFALSKIPTSRAKNAREMGHPGRHKSVRATLRRAQNG